MLHIFNAESFDREVIFDRLEAAVAEESTRFMTRVSIANSLFPPILFQHMQYLVALSGSIHKCRMREYQISGTNTFKRFRPLQPSGTMTARQRRDLGQETGPRDIKHKLFCGGSMWLQARSTSEHGSVAPGSIPKPLVVGAKALEPLLAFSSFSSSSAVSAPPSISIAPLQRAHDTCHLYRRQSWNIADEVLIPQLAHFTASQGSCARKAA